MKDKGMLIRIKNGGLVRCIAIVLILVMVIIGCGISSDNTENEVNAKSIQMPPGSHDNNSIGSRPQNGRLQGPPPNGQTPEGGMLQGQQRPHQDGMMQGQQGSRQGRMMQGQQGSRQGEMMQGQQGPRQGGMIQGQQELQQDGMMQGKGSKRGGQGSSISIEDANAIEDKLVGDVDTSSLVGNYPIVDTGTEDFYSDNTSISRPSEGQNYYGQDAHYTTNNFNYTDNGDGSVTDNVTGLMWQQDPGEKMTWTEAVALLEDFELAGYTDWRLPTVKELYSLIDFSGDTGGKPYIDTDYFDFTYGDETGERMIDSQYATSTIYESDTMGGNTTVFGVNFADGRIKGYPVDKDFYVMFVRGNATYGLNNFIDNGNGTITDLSTGLMWMTYDSGYFLEDGAMDWVDALAWAENLDYAGYDDWKLPDAKELQSIVDYTRSPDTTHSAAVDPIFDVTEIEALDDSIDYPYYWSSTTHLDGRNYGEYAVYIAFGEALGQMQGEIMDVHGAGAQRSDPKTGNKTEYPLAGHGPQGDVQSVYNYVRAVRVIN